MSESICKCALLMLRGDIDDAEETMYNGEPQQQHNADVTIPDAEPFQRKESVASTCEEQNVYTIEKPSVTLPHSNSLFFTPNRPSVIREMSVESSMTFCTAEQSVQHAKGLINKHTQLHHDQQRSTPTPEDSVTLEPSPHKKRKTTSSQFQPAPAEGVPTFAVPALPHRLAQSNTSAASTKTLDLEAVDTYPSNGLTAPEVDQSIMPAAPAHLPEARPIRNDPKCWILGARATRSKTPTALSQLPKLRMQPIPLQDYDDVDMGHSIVVAPKHTRTQVLGKTNAALSAPSPVVSVSHFASIADQVLRDIDVDTPTETEASQLRQPLQSRGGQGAAVEAGSEQPRKARYTAEQRSWLFEYVTGANGGIPIMPYADITRQFNQKFNEQRTERGITTLVGKLRSEYHANNGQQKNDGGQTGVCKKTQAAIQSPAALESQGLDNPSPTIAGSDTSQLRSVTRVDLLSQFKARTGEMQKTEGSQSPELSGGGGK
jgi:hypothetical protein